jgi:Short-chain dehydrogenases of various substrate specificities
MDWALIAGGSKGIGLSIAEALAVRKWNLFLVARNEKDLASTKSRIENTYGVQVEILPCDLSFQNSSEIIHDWCIKKNVAIKLLCNAAGLGGSKDFPDLQPDEAETMIRLNFESAVALIYRFIPMLKKNTPSYILNVASMAGFAPFPIKSIYSATKAALISFSYSLKNILRTERISVSCLCPGPVFTKPAIEQETVRQLGVFGRQMAVDPAKVGEEAVRQMLNGKLIIIPGKLAGISTFLLRILPRRLMARILYRSR